MRRAARADELVVDQVRGHPDERQVAPALPDDLVARGERDEVGEALERDGVAVADQLGHRLGQRHDLRHMGKASGTGRCGNRSGGAGRVLAASARNRRNVTLLRLSRRSVAPLQQWRSARGHLRAPTARSRCKAWRRGFWRTHHPVHHRRPRRSTVSAIGTMQLTGPGVWGPPADPASAVAVLRRAAELGVDLFDTADSYGPYVAEELLREALHPYDGLTIATKAGFLRTGPASVGPLWTAGVPAAGVRDVAAAARRRADRPLPAAPDRPHRARRRPVRRCSPRCRPRARSPRSGCPR